MAILYRAPQSLGLYVPPVFSPIWLIFISNVSSFSCRMKKISSEMFVHPTKNFQNVLQPSLWSYTRSYMIQLG